MRSVHPGVGATPAAWDGFTPPGGGSRRWRDRLPFSSKRLFARLSIIVLLTAWGAACAPRQIKPVAAIDPTPLFQVINNRQLAFENGLSGSLELAYKNGKQRFRGRVYIVAYPDGRFRLEVPGAMGGTHLVMANDNQEILAFYPGENRAFRSSVDGKSMNPHLPFPLPVDPTILPALIMGVFPHSNNVSGAEAHLMDSGEKLLKTVLGNTGLQFSYLFGKGPDNSLQKITIIGKDLEVSINTRSDFDHFPRDFDLTLTEGSLKGEWDSVKLFGGDEATLRLRLPDSVPVTDLEDSP